MDNEKPKRGFATLSPERRREISVKGANRLWQLDRAHKWMAGTNEVRAAGRKGGLKSRRGQGRLPVHPSEQWPGGEGGGSPDSENPPVAVPRGQSSQRRKGR